MGNQQMVNHMKTNNKSLPGATKEECFLSSRLEDPEAAC